MAWHTSMLYTTWVVAVAVPWNLIDRTIEFRSARIGVTVELAVSQLEVVDA